MRIHEGNNYSWYIFPTQNSGADGPHVFPVRHCVVCIFVDVFSLARWFLTDLKIWEKRGGRMAKTEREIWLRGVLRPQGLCLWTLITRLVNSQRLENSDKSSRNALRLPNTCRLMPAEYRQLVLDRRQLRKFNLENTGQSLMRHQPSRYTVKWAHWPHMTSISLNTSWQPTEYSTVQHVANTGNTVCGCTVPVLWWHCSCLCMLLFQHFCQQAH